MFRFLATIVVFLASTSIALVFFAHQHVKEIINSSKLVIYQNEIAQIFNTLNFSVNKLDATQMRAAYETAFKKSAIKTTRQTYYEIESLAAYPFIDKTGEQKWCIFKTFDEWGCKVGFSVPLNVKYADATILKQRLSITAALSIVAISIALWYIKTLTDAMRNEVHNKIEALSNSEQRFRSLIDNVSDAVFVHDESGELLIANNQACRMLGYQCNELRSMRLKSYVASRELKNLFTKCSALKLGESTSRQNTFYHRNQTTILAEVNISAFKMEGRKTFISTASDITERKLYEDRLIEEKEFSDGLINSLPGIFYLYDENNKLIRWNSRFEKFTGYDADELWGKKFTFFNPAEDRSLLQSAMEKVHTEGFAMAESCLIHKDGSSVHYLFTGSLVEKDGKSLIVGVGFDISDRKRAEAEKVLLSIAVENAAESIGITDPEGMIEYINPALNKTYGYSIEEVHGHNSRIFKSGEHDEAFCRNLWNTIKSGKIWSGRMTNCRKDASILREEATISPVRNSAGQITNFVAVKKDMTKEFELEDHLVQLQRMEAIGTLAGGIAHDINNILTAVIGYTELALIYSNDPQEVQKNLHKVLKASSRAGDLVKQILTFSRKSEREVVPCQPAIIVDEVLKLMHATLPSTIEIRQNIISQAVINVNPSQIHQILMNLCINAGHAMQQSNGILTVELVDVDELPQNLHEKDPGHLNGYVRLKITDTGTGMSESIQAKLFDPFFTTKEKGEGTGLGLSVVQNIVSEYEGRINLQSKPGHGTTFTIYLPIASIVAGTIESPPLGNLVGSEKVLFVDDEKVIADLAAQGLSRLGYKVTIALNGQKAFDIFSADPDAFDIVVTDITMPRMTGDVLTKKILAIKADTPIILCTGCAENLTQAQVHALGVQAFIYKPLIIKKLAQEMREIFDSEKCDFRDIPFCKDV